MRKRDTFYWIKNEIFQATSIDIFICSAMCSKRSKKSFLKMQEKKSAFMSIEFQNIMIIDRCM